MEWVGEWNDGGELWAVSWPTGWNGWSVPACATVLCVQYRAAQSYYIE